MYTIYLGYTRLYTKSPDIQEPYTVYQYISRLYTFEAVYGWYTANTQKYTQQVYPIYTEFFTLCALAHIRSEMKNVDLSGRPNDERIKTFRVNQVNEAYFDGNGNLNAGKMSDLKAAYLVDLQECTPLNENMTKPFGSPHAATYHCKKHGHLDFGISSDEYMNMIQNVIDNAQVDEVSFAQHGDSVITCYKHDGYKVLVITNELNAEYTMTMFKDR